MSDVEIKPCPFCNGTAKLELLCDGDFCIVTCNSCRSQGPIVESSEEAFEIWNTRRLDQEIENAAYERAKKVVDETDIENQYYSGIPHDDGVATLNSAIANIDKLKSSPSEKKCT